MKKSRIFNISLVFLLIVINFNVLSLKSVANPVPIPEGFEMGGIIYDINNSLNLINADVIFDIDSTDFQNNISILCNCNYTIYNPTNTTANITIYAPFSLQGYRESAWQVKVDSIPTDIDIVWDYELNPNLTSYFDIFFSFLMYFIVINTTIEQKTSQVVSYEFFSTMKNPLYEANSFSFQYILATAKAWENNITEKVEFNVQGKTPTSYTENTEKACNVSAIPSGRSYSWNWDNESINDDYVGISYSGRLLKPEVILVLSLLIGGNGLVGITLLVYFIVRKKKKLKERKG